MKTLETIKDEVATNHGYESYDYLLRNADKVDEIDKVVNEAAQLYAEEFGKGLLQFLERAGGNNFVNKHETILSEFKASLKEKVCRQLN